MITAPTQKLYYKKFVYSIKFQLIGTNSDSVRNNPIIKEIKNLVKSLNITNRTRLDWYFTKDKSLNITYSVYLSDDSAYQTLIDTYKTHVTWTSKPLTPSHKELLLSKVEIIFRDKLLYNRFKYKVQFKVGWRRENLLEITDWISSAFDGQLMSRRGDYLLIGEWILSLYLKDESNLTMVRLGLGEHILSVIKVDIIKNY